MVSTVVIHINASEQFLDFAFAHLLLMLVSLAEESGLQIGAGLLPLTEFHRIDEFREVVKTIFKVNMSLSNLVSDSLCDRIGSNTVQITKIFLFGLDGISDVQLEGSVALFLGHLATMHHNISDIGTSPHQSVVGDDSSD